MRSICIVYSNDAEPWSPYISSRINDSLPDIKIFTILDAQMESQVSQLQNCSFLIIIISPDFINNMHTSANLSFTPDLVSKRWSSAPNAELLMFFCGSVPADLDFFDVLGRPLGTRLPPIAEAYSSNTHTQMISYIVANMPKNKFKKSSKCKKNNGTIKIIPTDAAAEGGTVLTLILPENSDNSDVDQQIQISFPTDVAGEWENVQAKHHCNNVYSIVAPEHPVGEVLAKVFESGREVGVVRVKFASIYFDVVSGINQLYSNIIDALLETSFSASVPISRLDKAMASEFDQTDHDQAIAAQVFEKFFGVYSYQVNEYKHKFPTPMHLVAKWNLVEMAKKFLDLPDAQQSLAIQSVDKKTPVQMAKERQNNAIVDLIDNSMETEEFEEIYEKFLRYDQVETSSKLNNLKESSFKNQSNKVFSNVEPTLKENSFTESGNLNYSFQEELIMIINQVKTNKISQIQATVLFNDLKLREKKSESKKKKVPTATLR